MGKTVPEVLRNSRPRAQFFRIRTITKADRQHVYSYGIALKATSELNFILLFPPLITMLQRNLFRSQSHYHNVWFQNWAFQGGGGVKGPGNSEGEGGYRRNSRPHGRKSIDSLHTLESAAYQLLWDVLRF